MQPEIELRFHSLWQVQVVNGGLEQSSLINRLMIDVIRCYEEVNDAIASINLVNHCCDSDTGGLRVACFAGQFESHRTVSNSLSSTINTHNSNRTSVSWDESGIDRCTAIFDRTC